MTIHHKIKLLYVLLLQVILKIQVRCQLTAFYNYQLKRSCSLFACKDKKIHVMCCMNSWQDVVTKNVLNYRHVMREIKRTLKIICVECSADKVQPRMFVNNDKLWTSHNCGREVHMLFIVNLENTYAIMKASTKTDERRSVKQKSKNHLISTQ